MPHIDMDTPHWFLTGAGHIGTLAAWYLQRAGHGVTVLKPNAAPVREARIAFAGDGREQRMRLPVQTPSADGPPISHLIVACKTPYTAAALANMVLAPRATVVRLQNGMGSLDGHLPADARLIEAVTTNAVTGDAGVHRVVAENQSWMGDGGAAPAWFESLARCWPGLHWAHDIRRPQWRKLVANAAINPLTALYDVPNGRLVDEPELYTAMGAIVAEADALLKRLDPGWPGDSLGAVAALARASADNCSSMRADMQRGARTEIDAINGWLLEQGAQLGMDMPVNQALVERVHAATPATAPG
ncbi:2-dehydropantoate 2-reductase [Salinisphaera sp. T5B8]|uniref:ketopantoate reductase family protein n=1 Tax=Salinisphaera sp. T5B8 TaxID=1304154 RepID=UPI003340735F